MERKINVTCSCILKTFMLELREKRGPLAVIAGQGHVYGQTKKCWLTHLRGKITQVSGATTGEQDIAHNVANGFVKILGCL